MAESIPPKIDLKVPTGNSQASGKVPENENSTGNIPHGLPTEKEKTSHGEETPGNIPRELPTGKKVPEIPPPASPEDRGISLE